MELSMNRRCFVGLMALVLGVTACGGGGDPSPGGGGSSGGGSSGGGSSGGGSSGGGQCQAAPETNTCTTSTFADCGDKICCPPGAPFVCAKLNRCYGTKNEAETACGGSCHACKPGGTNPPPPSDCGDWSQKCCAGTCQAISNTGHGRLVCDSFNQCVSCGGGPSICCSSDPPCSDNYHCSYGICTLN